jgi:hypothetical protein
LEIANKSPGPLPSLLLPPARGPALLPAADSAAPLAAAVPPPLRHLLLGSLPRVAPSSCYRPKPSLLAFSPSATLSVALPAPPDHRHLCSLPRRVDEALEPPSPISCAHRHYENPLDPFLSFVRHLLAPRPRNAVAVHRNPGELGAAVDPPLQPSSTQADPTRRLPLVP